MTTRFEVAPGEFDNQLLVVTADPGPDAMQADAVELRQIMARRQLLKAVVIESCAVVAEFRQLNGVSRLTDVRQLPALLGL